MNGYVAAMTILVTFGGLLAAYGLLTVRNLDRLERKIAERKAAQHAAE